MEIFYRKEDGARKEKKSKRKEIHVLGKSLILRGKCGVRGGAVLIMQII